MTMPLQRRAYWSTAHRKGSRKQYRLELSGWHAHYLGFDLGSFGVLILCKILPPNGNLPICYDR